MKKCAPYIVIAVLSILLFLSYTQKETEVVERVVTDTLTIVRLDTIRERIPHFVSERVVDTIIVERASENTLNMPITQRLYEDENYKAWVSGYNPSLDSINVFNKVVTNNVYTTVTKKVYPKSLDWYLNVGSMIIDKDPAPYMGLGLKFKKDWAIGANVGYYREKMFYGINVGFKLNK